MENINILHSFYMYLPNTLNSLYRLVSNIPDSKQIILSTDFAYNNFYNPEFLYIEHPLKEIKIKNRTFAVRIINKLLRTLRNITYEKYIEFVLKTDSIYPKLIHSHFGTEGWKNRKLSKRLKIKHIVSFYGFDYGKTIYLDNRWIKRYKKLFEEADLFICEGNAGKRRLIELGCKEEKIEIVRLGIEPKKVPFYKRNKNKNELKLLQIASFREKKGHIYTVRAFEKALKECPNMTLTLVGSGEEKEKIRKFLKEKGIENRVKIFDEIPFSKLYEFMKDFHVFIHPSCFASDMDCEGGAPVVLLDAQATGMPVISTTHCDIPEEVIHGKTGLLAEEKDVDKLAKYIRLFYNMGGEEYENFSFEARKHVERFYDVRENAKKLREIYERYI